MEQNFDLDRKSVYKASLKWRIFYHCFAVLRSYQFIFMLYISYFCSRISKEHFVCSYSGQKLNFVSNIFLPYDVISGKYLIKSKKKIAFKCFFFGNKSKRILIPMNAFDSAFYKSCYLWNKISIGTGSRNQRLL